MAMGTGIRIAHIATVDLTHRFMLIGQLRRLRDEGFDVTAISAPGPYTAELEAEGIRHVPWRRASRSWGLTGDLRALVELVRILRVGRFDVVHTHNPKPGVMGRPAARLAGVPVVVNTVHGYYATPEDRISKRAVVLGLERFAALFSDLELFQSEEDLDWARRRRVVRIGRSRHLGNGTDLSRFDTTAVSNHRLDALRGELGLRPDELVVGTVGRMVAEKGYREFFTAAHRIRSRFPNVRFLVVGPADADKGDALGDDELVAASQDVVFAGFRTDMPELLALMDIFVLASWREGVPRSALEAAVMGRPLILTDIRGCREVARWGSAGMLVPPRDPDRLTAAIERLVRDPELRASLSASAAEDAAGRFDERRVVETVVQSYRTLLTRKGLAGRSLDLEGLRSARIRTAGVRDIPAMAQLHTHLLPKAFLPLLGRRFLERLFRALVQDPGSVALVAEKDGDLIGYAGGMTSVAGFRRRFLRRHGVFALLEAFPQLLRPGVLRRLLETSRYPESVEGLPEAESAFLGVRRGTAPGLGTELVREMLAGLAALGAEEVKGFVARDNRAMNHMVRRMGFEQRGGIAIHDGTPSNVYVVRVRPALARPNAWTPT